MLHIAQLNHFVPGYDRWFDDEYTKRWGEEHGVQVVVDHIPAVDIASRGAAEAAAGSGHDLFAFVFPFSRFEDQVIDHREIVEEVEAKLGPMTPFVKRGLFNPKTKKYIGFPDYWVANVTHYRVDLWHGVEPGLRPDTWDDVLRAGAKLKAIGHPLGLSLAVGDGDANATLMALMHAYGSAIQDEDANVTINSRATVEAVKVMTALYKSGMSEEVLAWIADGSSNNRYLANGTGSLILNAVSAMRAIEKQGPELAPRVELLPLPAGPAGKQGPYLTSTYVIWNFSRNQEAAKQFLVDLALHSREGLVRSEYYNMPSFPGAVPDLRETVASDATSRPPDKYGFLANADAWTTNFGHPGHANAAVDEVSEQFLIPKMFGAAARGEMTAEEAVRTAERSMAPIFEKWRERGNI